MEKTIAERTMSNKKNQHFVPRFLLRNFSAGNDCKSIGVWVIESEAYIPYASIKHQACADYFYGKGPELENAFETIEGRIAPLLEYIALKRHLPEKFSEDHVGLIGFVVSLSLRTQYQADSVNENADALFKAAFKDDPQVKGEIDHLVIRNDGAPALALSSLENCVIVSLDLDYKLLANKTNHKFITSDNPVIKCNQFYGYRDSLRGHLGFASAGLQLLLSIDPDTCLLLYDRDTYGVGAKKQSIVQLCDLKDVDAINTFEYLNAYKSLYFNNEVTEAYIRNIADREKAHRRKLKPEIVEYKALDPSPGSEQSIIQLCQPVIKQDLRLSFVRILKKAKKIGVHPGSLDLREPELVQFLTKDRNTPPAWLDKIPKLYSRRS